VDVSNIDKQILNLSNAYAFDTNGDPAQASVLDNGAYKATLGDYQAASEWLSMGQNRKTIAPEVGGIKKKYFLHMERFGVKLTGNEELDAQALLEQGTRYYEFLFKHTLDKKAIIFAKSRAEVETTIASLRNVAGRAKSPDIYRVHHGSISQALREEAERDMKNSDSPIVTGATVTLELGIDIGSLDRVIQLGAPLSSSSFVQRIGRCGRKGQVAELLFLLTDNEPVITEESTGIINWEFIKTIAIIQLFLEDKWIEPINSIAYDYSMLYHQTMSFMLAAGEVHPAVLAQNVLTLSPFKKISQADYQFFLRHLISIEHLQKTEEGSLMIGIKAEPIVTYYTFYSVFETVEEYQVRHQGETIGTVMEPYPPETCFALAGKVWETVDVNETAKILFVKHAKGIPVVNWFTYATSEVHTGVISKMRDVLMSDEIYRYLSESCVERLELFRKNARNMGILDHSVVRTSDKTFGVYPWVGSRQLLTLLVALNAKGIEGTISPGGFEPIYLEVVTDLAEERLESLLYNLINHGITEDDLLVPDNISISGKFNNYVPKELLHKQFINDYIDIEGLKRDAIFSRKSAF
jgi:ATP-dependent Lhr-like helicase